MSEIFGDANISKEGGRNRNNSDQTPLGPSNIESNQNSNQHQHKPDPPNWVEIGTLIVLVLAFFAAVAAAIEAHRLVTATGSAIDEARTGAEQQIKVLETQLTTQRKSLEKQITLLDLSTRPILVSNFADWQQNPALKAGVSPTISFTIKNVGHSNAQILSATYEYTIAPQIPARFQEPKPIENFPGLLPPDVTVPLVISGLPSVNATDFQAVNGGNASIWLRAIFIFRDDGDIVYEIRFTAAYSNRPDPDGGQSYGFVFPEREIPRPLWYDSNLGGFRCLNAVASEPHDFGCGAPQ